MIDAGISGERLVRGEPTEVREVRALMQSQRRRSLELVVADVIKALHGRRAGSTAGRRGSSPRCSPSEDQRGAVPVRRGGLNRSRGTGCGNAS